MIYFLEATEKKKKLVFFNIFADQTILTNSVDRFI